MEAKDLKKLQQYQMMIMDEFVKFCIENNIEYFLLGGSALGAVRHKGFIPWDDDMDVGLMRKDYEFGIAGVLWVKSVCNRMNKFMEEHREKWL